MRCCWYSCGRLCVSKFPKSRRYVEYSCGKGQNGFFVGEQGEFACVVFARFLLFCVAEFFASFRFVSLSSLLLSLKKALFFV